MKTNIHFWYLAQFFLEWKFFETNVVEKLKIHFMFSNFFFFENCAIYETMCEKYIRARQTTDDNTARAFCMLDD